MRKIVDEKLQHGRVRIGEYASDDSHGNTGAFFIQGPCGEMLKVIASEGDNGIPWEHVSVSIIRRCPNWQEMCFVKELFWGDDEVVMQLHPAKADYVNRHPFCLHLWRPLQASIPVPPLRAI